MSSGIGGCSHAHGGVLRPVANSYGPPSNEPLTVNFVRAPSYNQVNGAMTMDYISTFHQTLSDQRQAYMSGYRAAALKKLAQMKLVTKTPLKKPYILNIAPEIRNRIYEEALSDDLEICTSQTPEDCASCTAPGFQEPALLRVNRQLRSETRAMWYHNCTFHMHNGEYAPFLSFLGNEITPLLRTLLDSPAFYKEVDAWWFLDHIHRQLKRAGIFLRVGAIRVKYVKKVEVEKWLKY